MTNPAAARSSESSLNARRAAARLAAVQAVYQMMENCQDADSVITEFKERRFGEPVEDQPMIVPDPGLFAAIVSGVEILRPDLEGRIDAARNNENKDFELLLKALLLCASWELVAQLQTDAPLIISSYLDVAHAFFDQGEPRLINGILDRIRMDVRGT